MARSSDAAETAYRDRRRTPLTSSFYDEVGGNDGNDGDVPRDANNPVSIRYRLMSTTTTKLPVKSSVLRGLAPHRCCDDVQSHLLRRWFSLSCFGRHCRPASVASALRLSSADFTIDSDVDVHVWVP
jgi:hypothetical protein